MTAIHASLNAYLRYLDSPGGRQGGFNRAQLEAFNEAVHKYAVSKRNSSGNSTMINTRATGLQRQASGNGSNNNGNPSNNNSNAAPAPAAPRVPNANAGLASIKARQAARENANRAREKARENAKRQRQNVQAFRASTRANELERLAEIRRVNNTAARAARAAAKNAVNARLAEIRRIQLMNNVAISRSVANLNKRNNKSIPLSRNAIKTLIRGMKTANNKPLNKSITQAYINRYNKAYSGKASMRARIAAPFRGGSSRASAVRQGFRGFGARVSSAFGGLGNRFKVRTMRNKGLVNIASKKNVSSQ